MIDTEKYVKIVSSQTEKPKTAVVEINNQDITITENGVYTASAGYTGIGTATVNVPQPEPVIESINITPTTSEQTITASGGTDGYSPITVSAVTSSIDTNITAGNIKEGVSILGVEGGLKPAPVYYIEKTVDANGKAQQGSYLMDFRQFTDVDNYVFAYAYAGNTNISGAIDLSSLTTVSGNDGCNGMFYGCTGLTSVDLSALTTVSGSSGCSNMFLGCAGLTSINLSNLTTVSGQSACRDMFFSCTGLTSVDLSALTTVRGNYGCSEMFYGCSGLTSINLSRLTTVSSSYGCRDMFFSCKGLTSVDLSALTTVSGNYGCSEMFVGCSGLTSVNLSSLTTINGNGVCQYMFQSCTGLTTLSFPALTSTSFGSYTNQFKDMLSRVTGCTVHFPSNLQSVIGSWSDVTAGFGGTNTTVLFDLPATE